MRVADLVSLPNSGRNSSVPLCNGKLVPEKDNRLQNHVSLCPAAVCTRFGKRRGSSNAVCVHVMYAQCSAECGPVSQRRVRCTVWVAKAPPVVQLIHISPADETVASWQARATTSPLHPRVEQSRTKRRVHTHLCTCGAPFTLRCM